MKVVSVNESEGMVLCHDITATRLALAAKGSGIAMEEPSEGNVELFAREYWLRDVQ